MTPKTLIVVPCFNEEARWRLDYWAEIAHNSSIRLLFVDDGSSDRTADVIASTCLNLDADLLVLPANVGKGEAIRLGMLQAVKDSPRLVGFLDADGAFPAEEVVRLATLAEAYVGADDAPYDSLWSSRVLLGGRDIKRRTSRHYLGRAVATLVAPYHGYEVYDTQSGYKLFRANAQFTGCLTVPFTTRWFPDIEILQRWTRQVESQMRVWEEPVLGWQDVDGSKMNRSQYGQLIRDLWNLRRGRPIETGNVDS